MTNNDLQIRDNLIELYPDVYTKEVMAALRVMSRFNPVIKEVMDARVKRRAARQKEKERITVRQHSAN